MALNAKKQNVPLDLSAIPAGTAPFVVSSNTVVANLNADLHDGYHTATAATANTVVARDTNGSFSANVVTGNVTGYLTGTNQGKTGNQGFVTPGATSQAAWSGYAVGFSSMFAAAQNANGTPTANYQYFIKVANRDTSGGWGGLSIDYSTGDLYVGRAPDNANYATWTKLAQTVSPSFTTPALGVATGTSLNVTGQVISTQATGTAPFVVSSTTVVTNLNVDLIDGYHAATAATANTVAIRDANSSLTANVYIGSSVNVTGSLISNPAGQGVLTLGDANITKQAGSSFQFASGGTFSQVLSAPTLTLSVASGTAPMTVTSNTRVSNLNVDMLDGLHASSFNTIYTLPDTAGTASWVKLGTWTTSQTGRTLILDIAAKSGYNATTSQNQYTTAYFKTSNGTSNNAGVFADGLAVRDGLLGSNSVSPSALRFLQVSTTSYEVYGNFSTYTGNGSFYRVSVPNGTTWVDSSTTVAAPTGTYVDITPVDRNALTSLTGTLAVSQGGTGSNTAPKAMATLMGYTATATAAGTTTLTNTSSYFQLFTGTTTQTVVLPVTSTLQTGWTYHIVNNSTGNVTVNSSGANVVITVIPGTTVMVTCIGTSLTTAADWEAGYTDFGTLTGTGSVVMSTGATLTSATIDGGTP